MGFDFGIGATHDARMAKRDRNREDRFRVEDRAFLEADRLHQENRDDTALSRLVQGAKDAGLHPLAALGTNLTSGPSFSGGPKAYPRQGASSGSMDFGSLMVAKAQVRNLDAETDFVKEQTEASRQARTSQSITPDKKIDPSGNEIMAPQRTTHLNLPLGMGQLRTRPGVSDAQTAEDRYSEPGGWTQGLANMIDDYIYEVTTRFGETRGGLRSLFRRNFPGKPVTRGPRRNYQR